jgi:hydroxymethylglutaryl-CoA lyase
MSLPSFVHICEVGPREGMQFERGPISTQDKIRLIDKLSACGLREIEVTSFVSPKWVPQMADADEIVNGITPSAGTRYTAVYLNAHGLRRALALSVLQVEGWLMLSASELFAIKNTNRDTQQMEQEAHRQMDLLIESDVSLDAIIVMAAFGCNYTGDVSTEKVMSTIARGMDIAAQHGRKPAMVTLADSMGWVTPLAAERLIGSVRSRWPEISIRLHLHDTRGLAIASAFAAMRLGVSHFESSVGGLGGCPFGNYKGAAGNMVTEDFVHLCHESGVETGIDLDRLIDAAEFAQQIVGHALPGKILSGGGLHTYRQSALASGHVQL